MNQCVSSHRRSHSVIHCYLTSPPCLLVRHVKAELVPEHLPQLVRSRSSTNSKVFGTHQFTNHSCRSLFVEVSSCVNTACVLLCCVFDLKTLTILQLCCVDTPWAYVAHTHRKDNIMAGLGVDEVELSPNCMYGKFCRTVFLIFEQSTNKDVVAFVVGVL